MSNKYRAPSVKKAFHVLKLISNSERGLGVSELSRSTGMSKGTVHGITVALEEAGAIIRDPHTKKYNIGYTIVELGNKGISKIPLGEVAKKHMKELVKATGETVFLGVLEDAHILILSVEESNKELKITSPSGTRIPLTAGATGKLFLAYMEEKRALQYLNNRGLTRHTENTITDIDRYIREIRDVRKKGYALDYEEYLQGVNAVAVLINADIPVLAAIWVVGFSSSLKGDKIQYAIERSLDAVEAISRDLKRMG